jgi:hypothetical protein
MSKLEDLDGSTNVAALIAATTRAGYPSEFSISSRITGEVTGVNMVGRLLAVSRNLMLPGLRAVPIKSVGENRLYGCF